MGCLRASLTLLGMVGILLATVVPAYAQIRCGDGAAIAKRLAEKYGEREVANGVTQQGALFRIFASPSGSFTLLVTRASGLTCLIGTGNGYTVLPVQPVPKGTAA